MGVSVRILNIPTTLAEFSEDQSWIMDMVNNILIEVPAKECILQGLIAVPFHIPSRLLVYDDIALLYAVCKQCLNLPVLRLFREGIDCALDKGIVFGRPQIQFPENWQCVMEQVKNKEITSVTAMELLNLKKTKNLPLLPGRSD